MYTYIYIYIYNETMSYASFLDATPTHREEVRQASTKRLQSIVANIQQALKYRIRDISHN